ncbi:hypothetical protein HZT44_15470 [Ralstonia pickettii]|uniref:hypothetical protein n=1 Tax=Ralstonia pickettii TaxID=329 RepID=UPI000D5E476F|nr:hypothetical protein [Ralstonia pickettii]NYS09592.1 hypothetical protein [Ralstonia pickettii]
MQHPIAFVVCLTAANGGRHRYLVIDRSSIGATLQVITRTGIEPRAVSARPAKGGA